MVLAAISLFGGYINKLRVLNMDSHLPVKQQMNVGRVLDKLPPEAVFKVVDTVCDIIKANKSMDSKDQEFEQRLAIMRETNSNSKDNMKLLMALIFKSELSEDIIGKIVTSICNIAEGKSG